jgi:lipopolysaccharide export system protein LptC
MFETLKLKLQTVTSGNESTNLPPLDIIDQSTVIALKRVQNEGIQQNQQIWTLKAQKSKLENERDVLMRQRDERVKYLADLKRERVVHLE